MFWSCRREPALLSLFQASAVADLSASCDEFDQRVTLLSGGKLAQLLSSVFFFFFFLLQRFLVFELYGKPGFRCPDKRQFTPHHVFFHSILLFSLSVSSLNCDNRLGSRCLVTRPRIRLGSTSCDTSHTPVSSHLDCRVKPRGHMSGSRQRP